MKIRARILPVEQVGIWLQPPLLAISSIAFDLAHSFEGLSPYIVRLVFKIILNLMLGNHTISVPFKQVDNNFRFDLMSWSPSFFDFANNLLITWVLVTILLVAKTNSFDKGVEVDSFSVPSPLVFNKVWHNFICVMIDRLWSQVIFDSLFKHKFFFPLVFCLNLWFFLVLWVKLGPSFDACFIPLDLGHRNCIFLMFMIFFKVLDCFLNNFVIPLVDVEIVLK